MFVALYLDQDNYEFNISLHATRDAAEAALAGLLTTFDIRNTTSGELGPGLPPRERWGELFDASGEGLHLYRIECDGKLAEEIPLSDQRRRVRIRRRSPSRGRRPFQGVIPC
jgi:hypothetical protein